MNREIIASGSRAGPTRGVNQDRCAHWRGNGLVIALAADGVGGRQAGERAAWLVVDTFVQHLGVVGLGHRMDRLRSDAPPGPVTVSTHLPRPVQWVEVMLAEANERILDEASASSRSSGMATTAVVAVIDRRQRSCHFCHVGDSRAYMFSLGRFSQLTRDHVEYTGRAGRKAAVTRALGAHLVLPLEITPLARAGYPFSPRDVVLLCTDGLSGVVPDSRVADVLSSGGEDLSNCVDKLLVEVEMLEGSDDASLVLVMPISSSDDAEGDPLESLRIEPPPPPPRASLTPSQPEFVLPGSGPNLATSDEIRTPGPSGTNQPAAGERQPTAPSVPPPPPPPPSPPATPPAKQPTSTRPAPTPGKSPRPTRPSRALMTARPR